MPNIWNNIYFSCALHQTVRVSEW